MATLQTALTLTSAEFEREFAKAAGIVRKYTTSIEQQGNRALQRARGEVEALRLEASGHQQAAEALRQKMAIEEQATALAQKTGITQQNAIRITQRRIELEAQLAAQQTRTSRGGVSPRQVGLPELPLTTAEMNRAYVATEKTNKSLRALQGSGKSGALGFLAVSQAVEDAQYGLRGVLNNIPQAVIGFGGGFGLAGALSLAAVAGYQLYLSMERFSGLKDAIETAKAMADASDAMTEALRKNRDARAARNAEIERGNKVQAITTQGDLRGDLKLGVNEAAEADFQKQQRALERLRQARDAIQNARDASPDANPLEAVRAKFVNEEADAAQNLARAQERLATTGKEWEKTWKNLQDISGELFAKANAATAKVEETQRLIEARQAELAALKAEAEAETGADKRNLTRRAGQKETEIAVLTSSLKDLRAEEEAYNAQLAKARSTADASLKTYSDRIAATKEEIEVNRERIELTRQLAQAEADRIKAETAASQKRFNEELDILRAKLDGDQKALDTIDRRQRIEAEITRLMKEQVGLSRDQATAAATQKADAEDALRAKEKSQRSRSALLQTNQELDVLRLRAAGKEREAKALENEFKARADAIQLAKDANITELDALDIIRERQRLLDQIDKNEKKSGGEGERRRARIYKKSLVGGADSRIGNDTTAWGTKLWRADIRSGLGPAAIEGARASRPRDPDADARRSAMDYYNKNLQQNEELLTIWRTLGVG